MPSNWQNLRVIGWIGTKASSPSLVLGEHQSSRPLSLVNSNLSKPCLWLSEPRNFLSTGCGLMGSRASFPGGEKAKSGNGIP